MLARLVLVPVLAVGKDATASIQAPVADTEVWISTEREPLHANENYSTIYRGRLIIKRFGEPRMSRVVVKRTNQRHLIVTQEQVEAVCDSPSFSSLCLLSLISELLVK